jgi:hypothetical protein
MIASYINCECSPNNATTHKQLYDFAPFQLIGDTCLWQFDQTIPKHILQINYYYTLNLSIVSIIVVYLNEINLNALQNSSLTKT